jgi:uncharacterized protein YbjT (DUF2867 family)
MKAIITGSTGMVGKGVLLECLEDSRVEQVLLLNRFPVQIDHPKLKEIIHKDFNDFSPVKEQFKGYDACFFCLGTTSVGKKEEEYSKVTFDLTMSFAFALATVNAQCTFCYVSGAGTDSSEKGKSMWARVKGRTENALLKLFPSAYMFRPAFIQPRKGIKSRTALYNFFIVIFKPLYFILKPFKSFITDTTSVGKAMIKVAIKGYNKRVIESRDISILANK